MSIPGKLSLPANLTPAPLASGPHDLKSSRFFGLLKKAEASEN